MCNVHSNKTNYIKYVKSNIMYIMHRCVWIAQITIVYMYVYIYSYMRI